MDAFLRFNRGLMQMPVHWQAWMLLLVAANLVAPLFFINPAHIADEVFHVVHQPRSA